MQKLSHELVTSVGRVVEARVIAWGKSQRWLLLFLPYCFCKALGEMIVRRPDVMHLGDPVMCLVGVPLGRLFRVPTVVTAHGLDIVYAPTWYQRIVVPLVGKCARVVCISRYTAEECRRRGIEAQVVVIPPGTDPEGLPSASPADRDALEGIVEPGGRDRTVLLTVGRLVERKGVPRFIRDILPRIVAERPDVLYLVVGDGPQRDEVLGAIAEASMDEHVHILGQVAPGLLAAACEAAHLFVMPNQPVAGDIEGFGLVAIEANIFGLPVVASALEGISDAITPGENGYLVQWDDSEGFARKVLSVIASPDELAAAGRRARRHVLARFSWDTIAQSYVREFDLVAARTQRG